MYYERKLGKLWKRNNTYLLKKVFYRSLFKNLEEKMIESAKTGNTYEVLRWLDRGADIEIAGPTVLKIASENGYENMAGWMLHFGVSEKHLYQGSKPANEYIKATLIMNRS